MTKPSEIVSADRRTFIKGAGFAVLTGGVCP
jgi:hypothetical protein